MSKKFVFSLSLIVILSTAYLTLALNNYPQDSVSKEELGTAVNQAKLLYNYLQERGQNFSNGPCLSDALMPGWVLDIVHNPRQRIDDLPENQCPAYVEGRAKHFVELDIDGNFIRAE